MGGRGCGANLPLCTTQGILSVPEIAGFK